MVEYLPYTHNMNRDTWKKYDIQMYPLNDSEKARDGMWEDIDDMAAGRKPIDHLVNAHTERAESIIAAILTNKHMYEQAVNIPNHGYITNIPENAIVEVPAIVSAFGIHGIGVGKLPETIADTN